MPSVSLLDGKKDRLDLLDMNSTSNKLIESAVAVETVAQKE